MRFMVLKKKGELQRMKLVSHGHKKKTKLPFVMRPTGTKAL